MNITSLEIAQATMDMFFCLFCLIIFVSIKANNPKQKGMRMFARLFLIATVLFFGEALAYIFGDNLGLFNILVTRIANLMVFAMNIAMANTYVRFVSSVFVEKGAEVSGNGVKIADIFSCINIFIVVVNLFYPWMYYFDEANYCQTAHCGRYIPHFDFSAKPSPIVPYRHLPQSLSGMTADCRSLV